MQHSLSDESTCAASVLGSWFDLPDVIPCAEIVQVFKDKSKCLKGKEKVADGVTLFIKLRLSVCLSEAFKLRF
jgi:hypothetical protein